MKLLTITNLYPRPDQPRRGIFNAQLFAALAEQGVEVTTLVLVPESRPWRWEETRCWQFPSGRYVAHGSRGFTQMGARLQGSEAPLPSPIRVNPCQSVGSISVRYIPVPHLPIIGRNFAWRFHVRALRRHREIFDEADAVLATWLYPDALAAGIVAREYGKPFWVKPHGTDRFHMEHPKRGARIREVLSDAAGFLPNAQFLADYLVKQGVPQAKVHVVRHGVDHERFRLRPREEAIGTLMKMEPQMDADERGWRLRSLKDLSPRRSEAEAHLRSSAVICGSSSLLLYVGNLEWIKGPDRLLHAFAALRSSEAPPSLKLRRTSGSQGADIGLVIIGSGSMRGKLEQMAKELHIADAVVFLGSRSHEEVALWMNVADCLCLPSRSEGMPNVVIEALASGCPVVATDVGDVRWLMKNDVSGYVVENDDGSVVCGLSESIERALRTTWGRKGIAFGNAGTTWSCAAKLGMRLISSRVEKCDF